MAISGTDLNTRYSTTAGAAGDTTAGTGAGSLGKFVSTTNWTGGTLNDLFDDIAGAENVASDVEFRCIFIINNHATLTLYNGVVYVSSEVAGGASVALAVDNIGPVAKGSGSAQAAQIVDENTAPTSVGAFSTPTTAATGLSIGNLAPGQVRAVWIRRTAANTSALDADGFTLTVAGDTNA